MRHNKIIMNFADNKYSLRGYVSHDEYAIFNPEFATRN